MVSVIVVRPDGFWDKRVDSCTKSHKEGEVSGISQSENFDCSFEAVIERWFETLSRTNILYSQT